MSKEFFSSNSRGEFNRGKVRFGEEPVADRFSMAKFFVLLFITVVGEWVFQGSPLLPAESLNMEFPLLKINKALDKRTVIKPSMIPDGGNGLYALVPIKKGEVIGELGGRLLPADKYPQGNHYIAALLECAQKQAHPYVYLDSKDNGANVSRINFAPSKINGIDTHFQNSAIRRLCQPPYVEFYALRDIPAGEEIFSSLWAQL